MNTKKLIYTANILGIVIMVFFAMPAIARAANYYVASNGNDQNPGTLGSPFRTIQKGLDTVHAGDTCMIRGGTYYEALILKETGTSSAIIMLKNYNGETVTISSGNNKALRTGGRRHYYTIDGLRFTANHVQYQSDNDYTLDFEDGIWDGTSTRTGGNNGFIVRNCYVQGAILFYGHNNLVENCEFNGNNQQWSNGIYDHFAVSYNNVYRNNTIHGYKKRGVWTMHNTDNILIQGNTVYDCNQMGIDCDGAGHPVNNCQVIGNIVYNITGEGTGIELENSFNSFVEMNLVHDVADDGIEIINYGPPQSDGEYRDDDLNTIIRNNIIYNATKVGIVAFRGARGVEVYGNTIYATTGAGGWYAAIALTHQDTWYSNNWKIKNNIFLENDTYAVWIEEPVGGLTGLELDYNLYYHSSNSDTHYDYRTGTARTLAEYQSATGQEAHSIFEYPKLVSAVTYDFRLQSTSPAIDSGTTLPNLMYDFAGTSRSQGSGCDIGAYEVISAPTRLRVVSLSQ